MNKVENIQDAEAFMLKHGENVVDRVGAEIDRIEKNLRVFLSCDLCESPKGLSFLTLF